MQGGWLAVGVLLSTSGLLGSRPTPPSGVLFLSMTSGCPGLLMYAKPGLCTYAGLHGRRRCAPARLMQTQPCVGNRYCVYTTQGMGWCCAHATRQLLAADDV